MKNCRQCRKEIVGENYITIWPPDTMPFQLCNWICLVALCAEMVKRNRDLLEEPA